ncbi:hypothetical protein EEJ42_20575 [Streptomyces botrytidirepellens]|uniref:Uncharacterized protein n=2 Tax=Streptomyces botrytidirepellens TaxID=2486417 RepID=A0A3M8VX04_9ACTN|nr:hypothetical protein [Streptomyces botrytidirepellens]RNG22408.1 hypothetical protein EEJ42_20575 [Streptomyces botrytidirepellens]
MSPLSASRAAALRLLPWDNANGKPCYLISDTDQSPLNTRADDVEAVQLDMGARLLGHASELLADRKASVNELRFLANRLCEALSDVLRIARSRAGGGQEPS